MCEKKGSPLWSGGPLFREGKFALSMDSLLLADFVPQRRFDACVDLGCGAGLLCVLLGVRFPQMRLLGVELGPEAAALTQENLARNAMLARSEVLCGDIRQIRDLLPAGKVSLVVSNPPYFAEETGDKSADPALALARSETACTLDTLCAAAAWLLKNGGSFCLVHRPERLAELFSALRDAGLEPKRLRLVQHSESHRPSVALVEARRGVNPSLEVLPTLLLNQPDGSPSPEYRRICHLA